MLRSRPLQAVVAAEIVSGLGGYMSFLAIPWFVLVTTGSAARMGLVLAAELAPIAILGIPSGAIIARYGARTTMLVCDLARAPIIAAIPLLHAADLLSFPLLLALVALAGTFTGPHVSSQRLVLPEIVGEDEGTVAKANALFEGGNRFNQLAGPALAGVLIAGFGAANVLYIDAATFLVSFVLLATLVPRRPPVEAAEGGGGVLAGLRFLTRDPVLGPTLIVIVLSNAFGQALLASLPVLAYEEFDRSSRIAGAFYSALGIGAVAGTVVAYRIADRYSPLRLAALAGMLAVLPRWLLGVELPAYAVVGVLAAATFWNPIGNAPMVSLLTVRTPPALRAKVMTTVITFATVGAPAGLIAVGPLLDAVGPRPVLLGIAACMTVTSSFFVVIALRRAQPAPVQVAA